MNEGKKATQLELAQEDKLSADIKAALSVAENVPAKAPLEGENDEQFLRALAEFLGFPYVSLRDVNIDHSILSLIGAEFARKNDVMPVELKRCHLTVAMANPRRQDIFQALGFITGLTIDVVVATSKDVQWAIRRYYGAQDDELALESIGDPIYHAVAELELARLGSENAIVRLVNNIIRDAIDRKASDIHLRPRDKNVELLYRMDGTLTTIRFISKSLLAAVVSRIKILGGMNIAERRMPQDGRSCVRSSQNMVDLRISIMPTVEGESVVIRLLNSQVGLKSIAELGFSGRDENIFLELLHKTNGIFLVTGPTGSGKSTTLYAALGEVRKQNVNVITIEDPVEYHMDGVEQIQINHDIGYTFSRALRNILRHDPDVILVGEIRDQETAKIAVESALTGHLVLSTLHTNNAAGAITRLLEMGVEPYLLNGSLLGVLAQRLVKVNCPNCLAVEPVELLARQSLNVSEDEVFYRSTGCEKCNKTGVIGRMAVYELLSVDASMKAIIKPEVATTDVHQHALAAGMVPLTDNALLRARAKEISLAEVYRIRLD
jgi:type IV pilus assembly protein PilB